MPIWINAGRSLRYREHQNRKHGLRPDRFWSLHYTLRKKTYGEGVGWSSQGVTKDACLEILAELRRNWRTGSGPQTLKELRAAELAVKAPEKSIKAETEGITLERFWGETVQPQVRLTLSPKSLKVFENLMGGPWLKPFLTCPLRDIQATDLENLIVRPMLAAGRKPGTIKDILKFFSLVWHKAKVLDLVQGDCPVRYVKRPRTDNGRVRFLTPAEAARLLSALRSRSQDVHDFALLSLFTGLRAGECTALTWADVDFENGLLFIKDTKTGENRHAFMTAEVRAMLLKRREDTSGAAKIFVGCLGSSLGLVYHHLFQETVKALGLNDGVNDSRQRVVFHTCRHTFASWLVMKGQPLYTVSKLMGHRSVRTTERYAHLAPEIKKAAVGRLESFLSAASEVKLHNNERG